MIMSASGTLPLLSTRLSWATLAARTSNGSGSPASSEVIAHKVADPWGSASQTSTS